MAFNESARHELLAMPSPRVIPGQRLHSFSETALLRREHHESLARQLSSVVVVQSPDVFLLLSTGRLVYDPSEDMRRAAGAMTVQGNHRTIGWLNVTRNEHIAGDVHTGFSLECHLLRCDSPRPPRNRSRRRSKERGPVGSHRATRRAGCSGCDATRTILPASGHEKRVDERKCRKFAATRAALCSSVASLLALLTSAFPSLHFVRRATSSVDAYPVLTQCVQAKPVSLISLPVHVARVRDCADPQ